MLKSAYRAASKKSHADHGGSDAKFLVVKDAYEFLASCELPGVRSENTQNKIATTTNGKVLSDLGRGLGSTKNGRTCENCNGRGWNSRVIKFGHCLICSGMGMFRSARGYRACPVCRNKQHLKTETYYDECFKCRGTGEIELFNPVLAKMRVAGSR